MEILSVDLLPSSGQIEANETINDHRLLRLNVHSNSLHNNRDESLCRVENAADYDVSRPPSHAYSCSSSTRRRHKIGKGIQLLLLKKYVQCAKEFHRIPDRETTEQLLEQGYDEFYYQGGNLNEPRLSYAAFLKLVRNRRSEFTTHKRRGSSRSQSGAKRRVLKEQLEIRALINELELIRHSLVKKSPKCNVIMSRSGNERTQIGLLHATIPNLSDTSSIIGDASTDGTVSAGDVSTTETYLPIMSKQGGSTDDVVVSRSKLNLMLQMAQETLEAQKKLLEEVLISFTGLWKLLAEYFWEDFRHKKEIESKKFIFKWYQVMLHILFGTF
ncbi:hypothetical protein Plhal703r1_c52g0157341 [Plasmopara halstedii]